MAVSYLSFLETFLVEWKQPTRWMERWSNRHLETFLVEWKPDTQQFSSRTVTGLETFLVEWKLEPDGDGWAVSFPALKPS